MGRFGVCRVPFERKRGRGLQRKDLEMPLLLWLWRRVRLRADAMVVRAHDNRLPGMTKPKPRRGPRQKMRGRGFRPCMRRPTRGGRLRAVVGGGQALTSVSRAALTASRLAHHGRGLPEKLRGTRVAPARAMQCPTLGALPAFLAAAVAFTACADNGGGPTLRICTVIGCGHAVTIKAPLSATFPTIRGSSIEVCRNTDCLSGSFATLTDPPSTVSGVGVSFPDPQTIDGNHSPHVEATIWGTESGGFRLEVGYWPWSMDDLSDGDRFTVTVRDGSGRTIVSVNRSVDYVTSYPNGKECGPVCKTATVESDAGSEPDSGETVDASVPPACVLEAASSLPHVHIVSKATHCIFSVAAARAGISIPYDVVIDEDVPGFAPVQPYPYGTNVSSLFVTEMLRGGSQSYCVCDRGLPYASCPLSDGGTFYPNGAICEPTTLKKGVYPRAFTWDGVNWTGPSDTGNPKGAPFPPGDYTLTIASTPGTVAGDASAGPLAASAKLLVRLVK